MNKPLLTLLKQYNRKPIIQAPMAGVQGSRLTMAVNLAGGLGSLPCAMLSLEAIEQEVKAIRQASDTPVHLNFFAHKQTPYDDTMHKRWLDRLLPYYDKLGVASDGISLTGGRQPFAKIHQELVGDLNIEIVSFHFGLPSDDLLTALQASGTQILSTATTPDEAQFLAKKGVNGIIAQGLEAGGHRGAFLQTDPNRQLGTFALLPAITKAFANSPIAIIGAGGISDKATKDCAFGLGADLVQVGTAFLLANECDTSDFHRTALQSPISHRTALTNVFSGGLARGIVTDFMDELGLVSKFAPPFPHASFVVNDLKVKLKNNPNDKLTPEFFTSLWAGQNAPLAKAGSAEKIIEWIMGE